MEIIINSETYEMEDYSSLESLAEIEFEDKDLSEYIIEELGNIPSRLYNRVDLPCSLQSAIDDQSYMFDIIFDWADYVSRPQAHIEEATEAYIDVYGSWDRADFEDRYYGHFDSEEDFAENYLDDIGWDIDLSSYFDYDRFGEDLLNDYSDYTPEALENYRRNLGLPPLDEDNSYDNKRARNYGFIGDDEDEDTEFEPDTEETYDEDMENAEREYQDFIDEHSFEIQISGIDYDSDRADEYIREIYGSVDAFQRESPSNVHDYFDLESFARDLFSDNYTFENGYVFSDYY